MLLYVVGWSVNVDNYNIFVRTTNSEHSGLRSLLGGGGVCVYKLLVRTEMRMSDRNE